MPVLFATSDGLFLRILDGNFAGFREHKESLNLNASLKSNGWNLDPKFNTHFCDVEIGTMRVRSSFESQPNHEKALVRQAVIHEETEEEVERHEGNYVGQAISKGDPANINENQKLKKAAVVDKGKIETEHGVINDCFFCLLIIASTSRLYSLCPYSPHF